MKSLPLLFVLAIAVGLTGCGVGGGGGGQDPTTGNEKAPVSPASYLQGVNHQYFPLVPGRYWVLEGQKEGVPVREEIQTLQQTRVIQDIECTGIYEETFEDGELVETNTEWFAQDLFGNVWKFGEAAYEIEDNVPELSDDSWVAGDGQGVEPWLAFAGFPQVGDVFIGRSPEGEEEYHTLSLSETVNVPAGNFNNCMMQQENPDDPEDSDIILLYGIEEAVMRNGL